MVGVRIVGVSPNGPADKAGIRAGDIIIALNGQPLDDGSRRPAEAVVLEIMSELEPGDPVAARFLRDGTVNEVTVIAARFEEAFTAGISGLLESLRDGSLVQSLKLMPHLGFQGLELATISPSLGAYFGTTEGLLVVHVPESCGIGLEDGDVILRIDGEVPASSADALRLVRGAMGTDVNIDILRHGQEQTLTAPIPSLPGQSQWSWQYETD
ncbi:MAG: PDZ domain-containing protein [Pseudomonadota bacterium]